eukprot:TRINITY_DN8467_c0_g3_i1.p1 TRINITY_DN8467_c0_g3~~TRINITY_DN8467_c0_g3_i1.p1  ORF type:complete len:506 (-),score=94.73 TRINITY_DN8467_c0_g3_i1:128-1645(-)
MAHADGGPEPESSKAEVAEAPVAEKTKDEEDDDNAAEEDNAIRSAFESWDLDGSGGIDKQELTQVLQALDAELWTDGRISNLWNAVDANGDGTISLDEFTLWLCRPSSKMQGAMSPRSPGLERKSPASSERRHTVASGLLSSAVRNREASAVAALKHAVQKGEMTFEKIVPDAELDETWALLADYHGFGKLVKGQHLGDGRPWEVSCGTTSSPKVLPAVRCEKGYKGIDRESHNQDNFSVTYFKDGYSVVCVHDGHGDDGHDIATRTVRTVPYYLARSNHYPERMDEALKDAFNRSHSEVVRYAIENSLDVQGSGTTAAVAVWKGRDVWMAWAGDSKVVIASSSTRNILLETPDHKPQDAEEKRRIEACGGEVRTQVYEDGFESNRVYKDGEDYPGLAMARSLGDNCVKNCGVIATPDVLHYQLKPDEQPFLLAGSDGIWEFLPTARAVRVFCRDLQKSGPEKVAAKLVKEARNLWRRNEGDDYCDDITCLVFDFGISDDEKTDA